MTKAELSEIIEAHGTNAPSNANRDELMAMACRIMFMDGDA